MPEKPERDEAQGDREKRRDQEKQVDEDWKEEAKRDKERLAKDTEDETSDGAPSETDGPRTLPEPSFGLMVANLAIQALIALGEIANPVTRRQECDLDQAKHTIDLLGVLEEKTKGNLSTEEKRHLDGTLYELRTRYLQAGRR